MRKKRIHITQKIIDEVKQLREQGMSNAQISRKFKCSYSTVHYIVAGGFSLSGYKKQLTITRKHKEVVVTPVVESSIRSQLENIESLLKSIKERLG